MIAWAMFYLSLMVICWDKHTGFESVLPEVADVKRLKRQKEAEMLLKIGFGPI